MSNPPQSPPGWYPDPHQPGQQRYWDGARWTEHASPTSPQQPYAGFQPAGDSKPWWKRWWAITGAALAVLIIIAIAAGGGSDSGGGAGDNDAASSSGGGGGSSGSKGKLDSETGVANRVKKGATFRLGDFKVHRGWQVNRLGYDFGYNIKGLEVENVTDSPHTFAVDFKLHKGPHRIVATISCIAREAEPGDIVTVDCLPDGTGKPFQYLTIENSF
jgi:hypothetical protein